MTTALRTDYEHLTDTELAEAIYLSLVGLDDEMADSDYDRLTPAVRMTSALWGRLRGPYCSEDGCQQPHMASYSWCFWHRPASYGPLPDGFPPYPGS